MPLLNQTIESLIFASDHGISADEIQASLKAAYGWELTRDELNASLDAIRKKFEGDDFSFELAEIAGGFEFLSKKEYHTAIHTLLQIREKKKLSHAAMETLAIIAYKQPVSKPEIESLRGVNCDYSIQKLLEKELIVIEGKSDGPGRPLLYGTSKLFMEHFGLKSIRDLPKLKDLHLDVNEIGTPADTVEEDASGIPAGSPAADAAENSAETAL